MESEDVGNLPWCLCLLILWKASRLLSLVRPWSCDLFSQSLSISITTCWIWCRTKNCLGMFTICPSLGVKALAGKTSTSLTPKPSSDSRFIVCLTNHWTCVIHIIIRTTLVMFPRVLLCCLFALSFRSLNRCWFDRCIRVGCPATPRRICWWSMGTILIPTES